MDPVQRQVIDALLFRDSEAGLVNAQLARQAFWKAAGILDQVKEVRKQGVNWTQDDDPILTVKEKAITYASEQGSCLLLLTNMRRGRLADRVRDDFISIEVLPAPELVAVDSEWSPYACHAAEVLFTLDSKVRYPVR